MNSFRRVFLFWMLALSGIVLMVNWPRDGGSLKPEFVWMGFPWTFAHWVSGRLVSFDLLALCGDIVVNLGLVVILSFLCAFSRKGHNQGLTNNDKSRGQEPFQG